MSFCIPTVLAEELKQAAKRGEIDIAKMYEMDSEGRRKLFQTYVDAETAKGINAGFERAMTSSQQTALQKWAQETFVGGEKKKAYTDVLKKISDLKDTGILTPDNQKAFLEDLVAEKLGVTVSADEAQKIADISTRLEKEAGTESEFGTPTMEYFKIRREMDNYLEGITPSSRLKVASSIIARGNLLFRLSSPLLNIESNTVMGALQAFARRIETRRVGGNNNDYAVKYAKFANDVYAKTGYDVSRMLTLDTERLIRGEKQVTSQGKGLVRKIGQFYEDKIFQKTQGAPDVLFSSISFSDRANIESAKVAQSLKLKGSDAKAKSLEIFKDATRIDPQTAEGKAVRNSALADAMYSTYTNKSIYADVALGIRDVFNIASGDVRLGDQIMPFVKTPANVIGSGLNMSGIGVPLDAGYRFFKVINDVKKGSGFTESLKEEYQGYWKTLVQAGVGMSAAFALSQLFQPDDFIGEFPISQKERELLTLRNATPNSVKIGDRWVSLDYFGPLGSALTGLLYAKKYGDNLPNTVYNYVKGAIRQSAKIPGFDEAYNAIKSLQEAVPSADKTASDEVRDMANAMLGFVQSRITPGILYDIAKIQDTKERITNKNLLDKVKSAIPGLRETLPEKKTVFGDSVNTEPWYSTLFAGSRIKTSQDTQLIQELLRLDKTGNLPSITDISKTSPRAKELKNQIGSDQFTEAMDLFQTKFKERVTTLTEGQAYKNAPDDKRAKAINDIKDNLFNAVLEKYHYKKPDPKVMQKQALSEVQPQLASLVNTIGETLKNITPVASASENGRTLYNIAVEGDKVTYTYKDEKGTSFYKTEDLNNLSLSQRFGEEVANLGKALHLKELGLSEKLGFVPKEDRIKALQEQEQTLKQASGMSSKSEYNALEEPRDRNGNPIEVPQLPDQPKKVLNEEDTKQIKVGKPKRTVSTGEELALVAEPILKASGIPLQVAMAMRAAETRSLNSLGAKRNNFFNIAAFDSNPDNATSYQTPEDGIRAFVDLIKRRYPEALDAKTPKEAMQIIEKKGYAGDPKTYGKRAKNGYTSYSEFVMDTPEWRKYADN